MGRVAIIGIDGFSPFYMDDYLAAGELPALGAVLRSGVRVPLISTLPASTPVAWATMATGAPPSATGIEGFLLHRVGQPLDQRISACYSYRCRTEPIWETATLEGKRSYVVKFPLSYPSSSATFRLDGAAGWGGLKCFHEAVSSSVASTEPADEVALITPHPESWVQEDCRPGRVIWRGVWRLGSLWGSGDLRLHVALCRGEDGLALEVATAPDRRELLARLAPGEWSEPLPVLAPGRRGLSDTCFRIKVLAASASPPYLRLFNTPLHERSGHSEPIDTWQRHSDLVGPIEEQTEPSLMFTAGVDLDTQMEIFHLNADWLSRISMSLLTRESWDLFMVQIHIVDWAHHLLHGAIDPRHPGFDPATAPRFRRALLDVYRMADGLVDAVRRVIGPDADLVVLGDHGQDVLHTTFRTNEWLASHGLLHWTGEGNEVDWTRTKAYGTGNYVHVNQAGREPMGIVSEAEAANLRQDLVEGLLSLTDPATGSRPVLIAGEKREFERLGADGSGVGDVVFCFRPGYQATNSRGAVLTPTVPLREFTSGHDHFWPLSPAIHTRLFATGPSFRSGYRHPRSAHLVDVAPTVCAVLGIRPPAHCQGHAIPEVLAGDGTSPVPEPAASIPSLSARYGL